MPNREQLIRERAYVLWEQEGCPDGRADVHWSMAAEQIGNQRTAGRKPLSPRKKSGAARHPGNAEGNATRQSLARRRPAAGVETAAAKP
jgi:hypothetical protein